MARNGCQIEVGSSDGSSSQLSLSTDVNETQAHLVDVD